MAFVNWYCVCACVCVCVRVCVRVYGCERVFVHAITFTSLRLYAYFDVCVCVRARARAREYTPTYFGMSVVRGSFPGASWQKAETSGGRSGLNSAKSHHSPAVTTTCTITERSVAMAIAVTD